MDRDRCIRRGFRQGSGAAFKPWRKRGHVPTGGLGTGMLSVSEGGQREKHEFCQVLRCRRSCSLGPAFPTCRGIGRERAKEWFVFCNASIGSCARKGLLTAIGSLVASSQAWELVGVFPESGTQRLTK